MATTREFDLGETVQIYVEVKSYSGVLTDATSVTVTVNNPDGTANLTATAMTRLSTGVYSYFLTTSAFTQYGWYPVLITETDTTNITLKRGGFVLR